ncbi:MAG: hypothetical protein O2958_02750 [Gemmatimonadetes bacterium]|nr:hypothetical protein [Gemmatimonadota bacterium]MDA1101974.1 hypothetical protein [Gemmatimonadota bacterium]
MLNRSPLAGLGLLCLISASCDRASTIGPESLPQWSLGEPTVVLGNLDGGPTAFSPIRAVASGPRSEVHVLLPQDHQIRIFASNGDFVGEIGREGDGPGEFQNPSG